MQRPVTAGSPKPANVFRVKKGGLLVADAAPTNLPFPFRLRLSEGIFTCVSGKAGFRYFYNPALSVTPDSQRKTTVSAPKQIPGHGSRPAPGPYGRGVRPDGVPWIAVRRSTRRRENRRSRLLRSHRIISPRHKDRRERGAGLRRVWKQWCWAERIYIFKEWTPETHSQLK